MAGPDLAEIERAADYLADAIVKTPVLPLSSASWDGVLPESATVTLKLELFQQTGSFKARGALLGLRGLTEDQRDAGVVAASGGNHALAVAWAAQEAGVDALITMPRGVDPARIEGCKALGADVALYDDMASAFAAMNDAAARGRIVMHPFEADHMILGAATCGREYALQAPDIDTFVVPIGGGGLSGGMAAAIKQMLPDAQVIGVEPTGADTMWRSLAAGSPQSINVVATIADSLGAPYALPQTFAVAQAYLDEVVRIEDHDMLRAMAQYQDILRITAEPACAASLAALTGPLRDRVAGRHVGLIACGSNISLTRYEELMQAL